jgi:hypothetical protein
MHVICSGNGSGDGTDDVGLDPLLLALLKKIPAPEKGWPGPSRVRWFRTFAMNVSQIYDGDGDPVEMKIELEVADVVQAAEGEAALTRPPIHPIEHVGDAL